MTIVEQLKDLHKQATVDRSHFYTGSVIEETIVHIEHLYEDIETMRQKLKAISVAARLPERIDK